ncbi:DUF3375 family protein [Actinomadura viridis]|uniref:DUF3375 family protein n=1 Tax=Actinomadura viridis TaxID=58110 RepID=UPI0036CFA876
MTANAERLFHQFRSNSEADVTMSLLRSRYALLYLPLMAAHLGEGQTVDGLSLIALIEEDLPVLLNAIPPREHKGLGPAATDPQEMLKAWVSKAWVYRSVDHGARIERYQLTTGAAQAVHQIRGLHHRSSVATQSALSLIMSELGQIATDSDPDPQVRREAIDAQIAALEAQRQALDSGDAPAVDLGELTDRVAAVAQLIERIPTDLARYGQQIHSNTVALLRQGLAEDPAEFAETLERMFAGHDVISESPEALAFRAFATLVGTPSQRAQLEGDIDQILTRVRTLPPHLAESLRGFIGTTWQRVRDVERLRSAAFRRMSRFVQAGDARYYQGMRQRIGEARGLAAGAFSAAHAGRDIGFVVPMGSVVTESVGRLRLNEGMAGSPDPVIDSSDEFPFDPAALRGREAIDWLALRTAVSAALATGPGHAPLTAVLDHLIEPRIGDVIGLWELATRHGRVDQDTTVSVRVHAGEDRRRDITLPSLAFTRPVPEPAAPVGRRAHQDPTPGQLDLLKGDQ